MAFAVSLALLALAAALGLETAFRERSLPLRLDPMERAEAIMAEARLARSRSAAGPANANDIALRAVEELEVAARIDPYNVGVRSHLASALEFVGRGEDAVEQRRWAVRMKPGNANLHDLLGSSLARLGRFEEAAKSHRNAARLDPSSANPWINLAVMNARSGRSAEAMEAAERAVEIEPDRPEAHEALGMSLDVAGDPDGAVAAFERAVELAPEKASFRRNAEIARARRDAALRDPEGPAPPDAPPAEPEAEPIPEPSLETDPRASGSASSYGPAPSMPRDPADAAGGTP